MRHNADMGDEGMNLLVRASKRITPRSGVNSTSVLQEWAKKREVGAYILQQSVNFHRQGICPPHWWLE